MIGYALIGLGFACLAALFALPTVRFLERTPQVMLGIVIAVFVISAALPGGRLPPIGLGGINVFIMDLICPVLLVLAFPFVFSRLQFGFRRGDMGLVLLLIWAVFLFINYAIGLKNFGLQTATNEFRGYLYAISITTYVATLDIARLWRSIERLWMIGALAMILVALVGYSDGDLSRQGRPIGATPTFFILQSLILALFLYGRKELPRYAFPLAAFGLPMIVLLQHRSVWVVTMIALGAIFVLHGQARQAMMKWGTIGAFLFGGLAIVVFGEALFEALSSSYEEAVMTRTSKNTSTFVWRLQGWTGLLTGEQMDSARKIFFGNPFGTGWERTVVTSTGAIELRTESPHNYYLQTALRSGVVGLLVFLVLNLHVMRHLLFRSRRVPEDGMILLCLTILLFAQMVFYIPYGSSSIHAIVLGAAIAYMRQTQPHFSDP